MKPFLKATVFSTCIASSQAHGYVLDALNLSLPGEAGLEFNTVIMGRNRGDLPGQNDEHASSSSLIFDYTSGEYRGLTFTGKYITSWVNYEGGSRDTTLSPAESLNLSRFNLLNEAYLNYQIDDESYLRVGRQVLKLNFARSYNIRHKDQSFEALVYHNNSINDWELTLGHIEKFSSWGSRDFYTGASENRFVDVARVEGVEYNTNGFQFIEASYSGVDNVALSFYNYYGNDLYNSLGLHFDYSLHYGGWQQVLRFKYLTQQDVGQFVEEVDSRTYQLGVQFKKDDFSVEVGMAKVPGTEAKNNVRTPFQPNLIVEEPMFEVDLGFTADSLNLYVESSYSWQDHSLYFLVLHTDVSQSGITNTEADLIYGYDITDSLNFAFKYAYSRQDGSEPGGNEPWVSDYRFFFKYRF